jgi:precorrin isomerase
MKARKSFGGVDSLRRRRGVRHASLVLALSAGALVATTTPSWAGVTPHFKSASGSAYCSLLTAYDKKQTAANKELETPGAAVAAMKAAYKALANEESVVLGVAPSALQKPYKTVFKELNSFYDILSTVNFNYAKLSKADIAKFESVSKSMAASTTAITAYDKKTCGVKE